MTLPRRIARWGRAAVAAVLIASPAVARAQDTPSADGRGPAADRAERLRARREQLERRQDTVRQRQDELRRARAAARQGPMVSEPFSRSVRIGREGSFNLVNASGNVTITAGAGDDVRIQAVK